MWQQWDSDSSGYIERNELLDPQGLAAYVRSAFARSSADAGPPDIRNKDAWYEFWDEDHSGSLEKEEVVRALLDSQDDQRPGGGAADARHHRRHLGDLRRRRFG